MKILIVRTFPNIINPNQYNVQEIGLAKALTRAGYTCGIVLYYGKNQDTIETIKVSCGEEEREIIIYRLHGYNILKNGIFPSLQKIAKEYDVIQVHEYDQITSWFYYAWYKRPVVIYHGPYYHPFNKGYNLKCRFFDHTFLKLRHNKDTVCLAKSHAAEHFLRERGFKNVTAVGVGLDTDNFECQNKTDEQHIPVPDDKFNLLYVGKIEERRNPYFLLEVMEKTCSRQKDINCIIIGNGDAVYTKGFLGKAQPLIENGRLQYYPSASQSQLRDVYKKVQLMLFPTHYDIYGMVLLEALYFGLPVISTPNGGADMLLHHEENGWVLKNMNADEWCRQIEEIYTNNAQYKNVCKALKDADCLALYWDGLVDVFVQGYNKAYAKQGRKWGIKE